MKQTGIVSAFLLGAINAAGGNYDYKQNGADWPKISSECGLTNQSPIDLKSDTSHYKRYSFEKDDFNKVYTNQYKEEGGEGIFVEWKGGHTTQVAVNKPGQDHQTFNSKLAQEEFGSGTRYNGV